LIAAGLDRDGIGHTLACDRTQPSVRETTTAHGRQVHTLGDTITIPNAQPATFI